MENASNGDMMMPHAIRMMKSYATHNMLAGRRF